MPTVQLEMIEKVKSLAGQDPKVAAVLMYGSFVKGEGDRYSDIEFYLFHSREIDHRQWVENIRPTRLFFTNEFGTEVAIFDNLIRGEFHFAPAEEVEVVKSWVGLTSLEYAGNMILVDKEGRLTDIMAAIDQRRPRHDNQNQVDWLAESLLNNFLMTKNLLGRGEWAHAHQAFQFLQKYLIWLVRLAAGADHHWENPTKMLEREIDPAWYEAYAACVPTLKPASLAAGLEASFELAEKLFGELRVSTALVSLVKDIRKRDL